MPRNESEHSPMSGLDEYPVHQIPQPVRVVATTDPRAYERYWFTAQDPTGELFVVQGMGTYPNLDTAEAYAIVVHDGSHTAVRAHRLLGDDRMDMRIGPIRQEIVEPFREWRIVLESNDEDVTYDLRWRDTKRSVFHQMGFPNRSVRGRLPGETSGYETFGTVEGTVTIKGRRFELDPSSYRGSRDHHWGIRGGVGGPSAPRAGMPARRWSHCGQWVEFGDWSVWGQRSLLNLGSTRPGADTVQQVDHRLRFDPETTHLVGGVIANRLGNGELKEIHYEQLGQHVAYLRCGGYAGPDGGSPEENYYHGQYIGSDVVWSKTYDVSDPKVRMHLGGYDDHLCIATCDGETTVGILECMNPVLYEMCRDRVPGFSLLDGQ